MTIDRALMENSGRVLDLGGWFNPEPRATHVVDCMPWQTRGARLQLERHPDERFSKDTWYHADFLAPGLRLPFEDKWFDLVLCGQTLEDLVDPVPLLREMNRVGRAGFVACPSRLHEQTVGVRDRKTSLVGHPHHYWIAEGGEGTITFYSKADSRLDRRAARIPLTTYERLVRGDSAAQTLEVAWRGAIEFRIVTGTECAERALEFSKRNAGPALEAFSDRAIRALRRARDFVKGRNVEDYSAWKEIARISEQFRAPGVK